MPDRSQLPDPEFETYNSVTEWKAGLLARAKNGWLAGPNTGGNSLYVAIVQSYYGPAPTP